MKMIKDDLRRPEKGYPPMSDRVEKVLVGLMAALVYLH